MSRSPSRLSLIVARVVTDYNDSLESYRIENWYGKVSIVKERILRERQIQSWRLTYNCTRGSFLTRPCVNRNPRSQWKVRTTATRHMEVCTLTCIDRSFHNWCARRDGSIIRQHISSSTTDKIRQRGQDPAERLRYVNQKAFRSKKRN